MRISENHRRQYSEYYEGKSFGNKPSVWLPSIERIASQIGARTIIDYGCGGARCISSFSKYKVTDYDPAVRGCELMPDPADLVVSIHALEHVEEQCIDTVIDDLKSLAKMATFIVVSCQPSTKVLPDGTPWHSFVRDAPWWAVKLQGFTPYTTLKDHGREYSALRFT